MNRKKVAVVFNDIQGYTSLMQENESYAITVRQRHKEVVDRLTRQFQGTIIQYYGDGTLSIFERCPDAVRCAVAMQLEFQHTPRIPLRIGINYGEVVEGPDGVYGDSVNIASRIERMSVPGSVLIAEAVYAEIREDPQLPARPLGQFELKNVRQPVGLFALAHPELSIPEPSELAGKVGFKEKSIIVLPFFNLSNDPQNESLSDEITEQVITALSQMEGLRVTSRTSSFTFKDKPVNLRQLHQELGIDNVLEGSVRRHGNKLRITAQLINAADDFQLWSETYHREVEDAFQIQDEIALMISNKLKASFQQTGGRAVTPEDEDLALPGVEQHYQQGRFHWKQMQPGYLDVAIQHFRKALEEDAQFHPARAAIATGFAYKGYYHQMLPADASRTCLENLEEIQKKTGSYPRANPAWALYHLLYARDWKAVVDFIREANQKPEADPIIFQSTLWHVTALYQLICCEADKAVVTCRKALKADPLNPQGHIEMARILLFRREFLKALETVNHVLNLRPDLVPAHELKGWILFSMGRQREGIESFLVCRGKSTHPVSGLSGLAYAYARTSQPARAHETKEMMVSLFQDLPMYAPHYDLALAHLGSQEYDQMFEQLRLANEARMPDLIFIEINPIWDEIRRFNEYRQLVQRIFGKDQRPPL